MRTVDLRSDSTVDISGSFKTSDFEARSTPEPGAGDKLKARRVTRSQKSQKDTEQREKKMGNIPPVKGQLTFDEMPAVTVTKIGTSSGSSAKKTVKLLAASTQPEKKPIILTKLARRPLATGKIRRETKLAEKDWPKTDPEALWNVSLPEWSNKEMPYTTYWESLLDGCYNCHDFATLQKFCLGQTLPPLYRDAFNNVRLVWDPMCDIAYDFLPDDTPVRNPYPVRTK